SLLYGEIRERDDPGEISKRSLRPPFMPRNLEPGTGNRLCPAETRLKEGANTHDLDRTGGSLPLPRVGGALSARAPQYRVAAPSTSNTEAVEITWIVTSSSSVSRSL